jgi:hypothetical protein
MFQDNCFNSYCLALNDKNKLFNKYITIQFGDCLQNNFRLFP